MTHRLCMLLACLSLSAVALPSTAASRISFAGFDPDTASSFSGWIDVDFADAGNPLPIKAPFFSGASVGGWASCETVVDGYCSGVTPLLSAFSISNDQGLSLSRQSVLIGPRDIQASHASVASGPADSDGYTEHYGINFDLSFSETANGRWTERYLGIGLVLAGDDGFIQTWDPRVLPTGGFSVASVSARLDYSDCPASQPGCDPISHQGIAGDLSSFAVSAVPEPPASALLVGGGLLLAGVLRRRRSIPAA